MTIWVRVRVSVWVSVNVTVDLNVSVMIRLWLRHDNSAISLTSV